jgi:hypothetical protein
MSLGICHLFPQGIDSIILGECLLSAIRVGALCKSVT